jgi:hypothetical protein
VVERLSEGVQATVYTNRKGVTSVGIRFKVACLDAGATVGDALLTEIRVALGGCCRRCRRELAGGERAGRRDLGGGPHDRTGRLRARGLRSGGGMRE